MSIACVCGAPLPAETRFCAQCGRARPEQSRVSEALHQGDLPRKRTVPAVAVPRELPLDTHESTAPELSPHQPVVQAPLLHSNHECKEPVVSHSAQAELWLMGVDARRNPIRVPLDRESIVIGGDPQCEVPLQDPYISRRHVRIGRDRDMVLVEDLASSNGTYVRIRRAIVLEPGDELLVGTTVLRLQQGDS